MSGSRPEPLRSWNSFVWRATRRWSGSSWRTWPWTGASPRPRAVARPPGGHRWTAASRARNGRCWSRAPGSRWVPWWPQPTATTPRCCARRWRRCPGSVSTGRSGSPCTWTPTTTRRAPGGCSPSSAVKPGSRSRACPPRSRTRPGGWWNGRTLSSPGFGGGLVIWR